MNGLITFVLVVLVQVSVLAQASVIAQVLGQGAEVLPDSKNGPVLPNSPPGLPGISGIPGISGPRPTSQTSVGWGNDPEGIFCIIVQIPPEKIAGFAQGETGNELFANIPPDIQPYVQRVIVRVGTGPVEKRPPTQRVSNVRPFAAPHVANLDNPAGFNDKSLLSIDQPARLLDGNRNTAQLGQTGPGSFPWPTTQNPTTSGGTTGFDNSGRMMVNTNTGNGAYGNGPAPNNSANPGGAREIMPNTTGSTQNYGLNDNFQPASPAGRSLNFFGSNNGTSSSPSPYANAGNPSLYNRDNRTAIPYLASNANPTTSPGYLDNHGLQPGGQAGYPAPPSSLTQQQQSPYANPPYVNSNSVPPFRYTSGTQFNSELPPINDQPQPTDKLLPFLLLFSIIGNVYFVLWMGHLRHRYRQLLSDKRGIPISVLEN